MRKKPQVNCVIASPIGNLGLVFEDGRLINIQFLPQTVSRVAAKTPEALLLVKQLKSFFSQSKFRIKFPLKLFGTPLQKRIWQALQKIPVGKTLTYGELAERIGTSPRVIGNACRRNPIPIIIPCHRVVAAKGVGGFCGKAGGRLLEIKKWLLAHENRNPTF